MAVFTWVPSVGASLDLKPNVRRVSFGDGYEQRLAFGLNTQAESWSLEFRGQTSSNAQAIDAFLRLHAGVQSFEWVTPLGATGKFTCEQWSRSVDEPNVETIRATFKQVFDLS